MGIGLSIAVYLTIWWMVFLLILPIGVIRSSSRVA